MNYDFIDEVLRQGSWASPHVVNGSLSTTQADAKAKLIKEIKERFVPKQANHTPRAVKNGMSQAEYDIWMFLSDKKALKEPYTFAVRQSELIKFIQSNYIPNSEVEKQIEAAEKLTADIEFKAGINHATMSGEWVSRAEVKKLVSETAQRELADLAKTFSDSADRAYTGQQVRQVINARIRGTSSIARLKP